MENNTPKMNILKRIWLKIKSMFPRKEAIKEVKAIEKSILRDIWRNYKVYICFSPTLLALLIYENYHEPFGPFWFWLMVIIVTGGYIAIIVYDIKEFIRIKKGGATHDKTPGSVGGN